ncbi:MULTISPECIES: hypothetical protein [unclassified Pannonibacter]|uniref:hypothetical protein n=1 Tax=unclassified Pannonibacter TaxID=2627228 RepID=UPI001647AAD4|nr:MULTISPECIES: hypothetical protein [unclassified Pannonibacter]
MVEIVAFPGAPDIHGSRTIPEPGNTPGPGNIPEPGNILESDLLAQGSLVQNPELQKSLGLQDSCTVTASLLDRLAGKSAPERPELERPELERPALLRATPGGTIAIPAHPISTTPLSSGAARGQACQSSTQPSTKPGWTNQEIADLYRVEALLVQAGIRISSAQGLSDENDPWFVFCREDGDVFVHLARTGGTYLLDSPGLGALLQGPDFPALIDSFVRQLAERNKPAGNVITFHPRMLQQQTVRLHPAVMLAALVWTLFLASNEMSATAQAAEDITGAAHEPATPSHADLPHTDLLAMDLLNAAKTPEQAQEQELAANSPQSGGTADRQNPSLLDAARILQTLDTRTLQAPAPSGAAASAQALAVNLAVIAIGYGLQAPDPSTALPGLDTDAAAKALEASFAPDQDHNTLNIQAETSTTHAGTGTKTPQAHTAPEPIYAPLTLTVHASTAHIPAQNGKVENGDSTPPATADSISTAQAGTIVTIQAADLPERISTAPATPSTTEADTLISLVSKYLGAIANYQLGGISVSTTINPENLDKVLSQISSAAGETPQADHPAQPQTIPILTEKPQQGLSILGTTFSEYNDLAKKFVHAFILDAGAIQMLQIKTELLLVDLTAIDEQTDIPVIKSWITEDGHVISTIGHQQTFIEFGIV